MTRQYWANLVLCIVLAALAIFSVTQVGSVLAPKGLFVCEPEPSQEAGKILHDIQLAKFQISEGMNNMVAADFLIRNNSDHSIKNITVLCEFMDENGIYRDRHVWNLAETIPAMHQAQLSSVSRRFVNSNARALQCGITDFQPVKRPFFTLDRHLDDGYGGTMETGHGEQIPTGH
ncbi:MAG: hypothetical protein M8357_02915 [Desulfobulbaceae bacterium]|nr:hypothetical protein [Desulfobulbaceae bacterium]